MVVHFYVMMFHWPCLYFFLSLTLMILLYWLCKIRTTIRNGTILPHNDRIVCVTPRSIQTARTSTIVFVFTVYSVVINIFDLIPSFTWYARLCYWGSPIIKNSIFRIKETIWKDDFCIWGWCSKFSPITRTKTMEKIMLML